VVVNRPDEGLKHVMLNLSPAEARRVAEALLAHVGDRR
jgi:hypothetical protein